MIALSVLITALVAFVSGLLVGSVRASIAFEDEELAPLPFAVVRSRGDRRADISAAQRGRR